MDSEPPIPDDISDELRDFLQLCFIKDPEARPAAVVLFEHPWIKKLNPDLVSVVFPPLFGTNGRPSVPKTAFHFCVVSAWICDVSIVPGSSPLIRVELLALKHHQLRMQCQTLHGSDIAMRAPIRRKARMDR